MSPRILCITPGTSTIYRVWLLGREVCATDLLDKAQWAMAEARLALIQATQPYQMETAA